MRVAKLQLFEFTFPLVKTAELGKPVEISRPPHRIKVLGRTRGGAEITATTIYRRTWHLDPSVTVLPVKVEVIRPTLPRSR